MPIPAFTIDGILPPYVGPDGPGGSPQDMSPYAVTTLEIAVTLGTTEARRAILRGWLDHRAKLRALGFVRGFQWVDGSFVEKKDPNDIDVVAFLYPPVAMMDAALQLEALNANADLFDRHAVKKNFKVDFMLIGLSGSPEGLVAATSYYLGLFSHRRKDDIWKGMLRVSFDQADDEAAIKALNDHVDGAVQPAVGEQP